MNALIEKPEAAHRAAATGGGSNGAVLVQDVPLGEVVRSPFNREVDTKSPEFKELVESIRIHGVIQPGVARPTTMEMLRKPGAPRFELVIGEHRWLGSKEAKRATIPLIVRQLSDVEVVELQTVENDKRKDLSPIEEAEKYQQLIGQYEKSGLNKEAAIAKLCEKLSKGKSTVYEALRLLKLPAEAKAAVKARKLPPSHAGLLGKLDDAPEVQNLLTQKVLNPEQHDDTEGGVTGAVLAYRELKQIVDREIKLKPARAKWLAAAQAHRANGGQVMTEEQIAKVVTYWGGTAGGWVPGSNKTTEYVGCGQYPGTELKKLMGKHAPPATLAHDRDYKILELYPNKLVRKAIEANGYKRKPRQTYSSSTPVDKNAEQKRQERLARAKRMQVVGVKAKALILEAATKPKPKFPWSYFLSWVNDNGYTGLSQAQIKKADSEPLQRVLALLIQVLIDDGSQGDSKGWDDYEDDWHEDFAAIAKHYGIDLAKLTKELAPEPKKEQKVAKKAKVQTSGSKKTAKRGLTAAGRTKLAAAMKARWAARRKAAGGKKTA